VTVRHDRVHADVDDQPGAIDVEVRVEPGETADLVGHEHLRGAVDGQGTETRWGAHRPVQRLGGPVAGRVHADAAAEEDANRLRTVAVDDGAQPGAEVVEARVPRCRLQRVARPHQRMLEPVGVMVQLRQRPPLRTGVAVRERVVAVTAHTDDLVTRNVDEDPAHRRADPAEAPDGAHVRRRDGSDHRLIT